MLESSPTSQPGVPGKVFSQATGFVGAVQPSAAAGRAVNGNESAAPSIIAPSAAILRDDAMRAMPSSSEYFAPSAVPGRGVDRARTPERKNCPASANANELSGGCGLPEVCLNAM